MKTEKIRALYQGYVETVFLASRKECPSSEEMINSFNEHTSQRKKRKIIEHITVCARCREEFMVLIKLQEEFTNCNKYSMPGEKTCYEKKKPSSKHAVNPLKWQYAIAFMGVSLIIFSFFIPPHLKRFSASARSNEIGIALLYPKSTTVSSGMVVFSWEKREGAQYYILELFDEVLSPVWTSPNISGTSIELPSEIRLNMRPGVWYHWMVTAFSESINTDESHMGRFKITDRD